MRSPVDPGAVADPGRIVPGGNRLREGEGALVRDPVKAPQFLSSKQARCEMVDQAREIRPIDQAHAIQAHMQIGGALLEES